MKVTIVGTNDWSNWYSVEQVVATLGAGDVIVHNGSYALGGKIDRIVARKPRARRPKVEIVFPETHKYNGADLLRQNALQLVGYHRPQVVVWFGDDGLELEIAPAIEYAELYHTPAQPWDEFVKERTQRA